MKKLIRKITVACITLTIGTIQGSYAQENGTSETFSPYSVIGLGDMLSPANLSQRMMGGVGIASANPYEINYLNPAALGNIRQRSALFNFGVMSQNYYSTATSSNQNQQNFTAKDVGNNVSVHDIAFAIPLWRGIGFSVAMTPVSNVGYNTNIISDDTEIANQIGTTVYQYRGEGGLSSITGSIGMKLSRGLKIGASAIYYFGATDRFSSATIVPLVGNQTFAPLNSKQTSNMSKVTGNFGAQYSFRLSTTGYLSIGATYQLKTNIDANISELTTIGESTSFDVVKEDNYTQRYIIPQKIGAAIMFESEKLNVALDYTYQDWTNAFEIPASTNFNLNNQNYLKFGVAYTPNRNDIRHALNRWTYKAGVNYGTSYLSLNDNTNPEYSFSIGADVPLKSNSFSKLSFGFEYFKRGTTQTLQVQESIFRIFMGFTFFGDDLWFEQRKFN